MNDSSRTQGGLICIGVVIVGAWFLLGLLKGSYWALAIPVAVLVFFVLGLTFWVGYTIATIQVDPYQDGEPEAAESTGTAEPAESTGTAGTAATSASPEASPTSGAAAKPAPHDAA